MAHGKFVSYLRVSTSKQGEHGLGVEAQRKAVTDYLNGGAWTLIAEYVEVESGKNDARPKLAEALRHAKMTGSTLVVAKLDRLSRNVAFLASLQESKVKFVCADMPEANEFTVNILACVAQHERKAISERTRNAMQAAKAKGRTFGNPNGARALQGLGNEHAVKVIQGKADRHAQEVLPIIHDIQTSGTATLKGIAHELNERGILTARGGQWHPTTVKNLLERAIGA